VFSWKAKRRFGIRIATSGLALYNVKKYFRKKEFLLMLRLFGLIAVTLFFSPQATWGQARPSPAQPTPLRTTFPNVRGLSQDYRVGAGDTLEIQVVDATELNQTVTVSAAGEINFLSVGAIAVEDLTAAEVEARIASALKEKKMVQEPQVLVFIREYRAKRVYLMGEFAFPGEFVMSQTLTVMDAILLAGGLSSYAPNYGYLHRHVFKRESQAPPPSVIAKPDLPREGTDIFQIDLKPILEGNPPEPDLMLKEGDYLIVPRKEAEFFFVLGDVAAPLSYEIPEGRTVTVSQAIAQAGGPRITAKPSKTILSRMNNEGQRQEIKFDFWAILSGKREDIEVKRNDIIYVPSSKLAAIREQYITSTDLFAEGTAFRIGRYYQLPEEAR
jgi:polysaccharide biosynthesis/export protein